MIPPEDWSTPYGFAMKMSGNMGPTTDRKKLLSMFTFFDTGSFSLLSVEVESSGL